MKQLKKNTVCYYCYGCNKLILDNFDGVKHCNGFKPAYSNWQEEYYKELREEKNGDSQSG